jgi:predicted site-specific integrase-resolvase
MFQGKEISKANRQGYARISSKSQESNSSLESQIQKLKE